MTPSTRLQTDRQQAVLTRQAAALRQHMTACMAQRGRWHAPAAWAESAHQLLAPRFVTTVGLVVGMMALGLGWL